MRKRRIVRRCAKTNTKPVFVWLPLVLLTLFPISSFGQESGLPPEPPNTKTKTVKLDFDKRGAIVYRKTDSFELKCDVYVPEGKGPYPAILAVHGGAWRTGTKFALLRHAWRMAENGYVVVAINYRHAPEFRFPAQIHDCKFAVRWLKANADEYKIDPTRVGAFGYSAGGHLCALLGTTKPADGLEGTVAEAHKAFDSSVLAVAAGGPPCDFEWVEENSRVLSYWLGGSKKEKPEMYLKASPINYVSSDDVPFFLFHGDSDLVVPVKSSLGFHNALLKKGVSSKREIATKSGHLGTFSDLKWMDKSIEFFDSKVKAKEQFKRKQKSPLSKSLLESK